MSVLIFPSGMADSRPRDGNQESQLQDIPISSGHGHSTSHVPPHYVDIPVEHAYAPQGQPYPLHIRRRSRNDLTL